MTIKESFNKCNFLTVRILNKIYKDAKIIDVSDDFILLGTQDEHLLHISEDFFMNLQKFSLLSWILKNGKKVTFFTKDSEKEGERKNLKKSIIKIIELEKEKEEIEEILEGLDKILSMIVDQDSGKKIFKLLKVIQDFNHDKGSIFLFYQKYELIKDEIRWEKKKLSKIYKLN